MDEAFPMLRGGGGDDAMAGIENLLGPAVMDLGRSQISDAGVVVLVVVPGEEPLAEDAPLLDRAEAAGELRAVLQGLELRLRDGVVVGHVGPAVGLFDTQVRQELGHGPGAHRASAVGVSGQLAGGDPLLAAGLGDQLGGQRRRLGVGQQPAHDVAAEDVEQDVEVQVGPLLKGQELRDVPGPDLVGARGQELRPGINGMNQMVSPLASGAHALEHAVDRAGAGQIQALILAGEDDLPNRKVPEPFAVDDLEDLPPFIQRVGPGRGRVAGDGNRLSQSPAPAVDTGPGNCQSPAGGRNSMCGSRFFHHPPQKFSSLSGRAGRSIPRSSDAFFWRSIKPSSFLLRSSRRAFSRWSRAFSAARGLTATGLLPRLAPGALRAASCRSLRQVARCEECSLSRRSSIPTSPGCRHRSASSTIRILYSRVKLRRLATATTSGSGAPRASRPEEPLRSLRSSSATALAAPNTSTSSMIVPNPFPALLTNFPGGRCLTHVGTEGSDQAARMKWTPPS